MNGQNLLNGFQLDRDFVVDDQVHPVTAVKLNTLVRDRKRTSVRKRIPRHRKFMAQDKLDKPTPANQVPALDDFEGGMQ